MKKEISFNGIETFMFGSENNKLRIFPPNSYKFRPKDHIILDEVQKCILDNFWYQYNHKREKKDYMLSILNSLAEYFHTMNSKMPPTKEREYIEKRLLYVIFEGKMPDGRLDGEISWKKYGDIDKAMNQKTLKEEIMMELKGELYNKFEEFKREFDVKMDISLSGSEENDDITGHGQRSE
ncbi:hypothetical protein U9M48_012805 [Paspalum notatum var. saurae]|uniref:Uncharacterized protein n=1 Tax=Paspalum notatum var. saurae TaxID=547442 RepID=A0AAQ3WIR3_PASNO